MTTKAKAEELFNTEDLRTLDGTVPMKQHTCVALAGQYPLDNAAEIIRKLHADTVLDVLVDECEEALALTLRMRQRVAAALEDQP